jgi:hypothetical protein
MQRYLTLGGLRKKFRHGKANVIHPAQKQAWVPLHQVLG